jgi:tRNA threonylcarbamoyladenosine biosynthesis protein TsaE
MEFERRVYLEDISGMVFDVFRSLHGGEVFGLSGPLGAGKTFFTQELLREMGVAEVVTSPTYNIAKSYSGRLADDRPVTVWHLDLYRISSAREVLEMGVFDMRDSATILVVEWPERALDIFPSGSRFIEFLGLKGDE